jgi:hypothetical protein
VSTTRRQLIGRGIGVAGVAALPTSLLAATPALAQESDETDAIERIVELQLAAELAYSLAAEDGKLDAGTKKAFELFGKHSGDQATALSEALDQLDVDPPETESDPASYERLADFDAKAPAKEQLKFMIGLEEELIKVYEDETPTLEAEDLVRSAAQIGAAHAQMLVALRLLAGEPPVDLLPLP